MNLTELSLNNAADLAVVYAKGGLSGAAYFATEAARAAFQLHPELREQKALDLTGAYYLHLAAEGVRSQTIRVRFVDNAQAVFADFRDSNNLGGSEMGADCGKITDANGNLVATICYNGRVRMPDGTFMDGMSGRKWLDFCAAGR